MATLVFGSVEQSGGIAVTWQRNGPTVLDHSGPSDGLVFGAAEGSIVRSMSFVNTTTTTAVFRASHLPGATLLVSNALFWDTPIPPLGVLEWNGYLHVPTGSFIKAKQTTASAIVATATAADLVSTPSVWVPRTFTAAPAVASSYTSVCAGAASGSLVRHIHVANTDSEPSEFSLYVSTTSTPTISVATPFAYDVLLAANGTWDWDGELWLDSDETLYGQAMTGTDAAAITIYGYAEDA